MYKETSILLDDAARVPREAWLRKENDHRSKHQSE